MTTEEMQKKLQSWIKGVCLADHLGDVCNDLDTLSELAGLDIQWDDLDDLYKKLDAAGVKGQWEE